MKNNFEALEEHWGEEYGPAPGIIRENVQHTRNTVGLFGGMIELFIPRLIQLFVGLLGGKSDEATEDTKHKYPNLDNNL